MQIERIGIRELRQQLSSVIRRVRSGRTLEVTDRGRTVARIVPVAPSLPGAEQLIAEGKLYPPRSTAPLPAPLEVHSIMTSEEAIDLLRGD